MSHVCSVAGMWLLLLTTGCPHAFGRGGTIEQAALKDTIERPRKNSCHPDDVLESCGEDGYERCMEACEEARR
jgi:hypothetical protein